MRKKAAMTKTSQLRVAVTVVLCLALVACGGGAKSFSPSPSPTQNQTAPNNTQPSLTALSITAGAGSFLAGQTSQMTANGTYSDGSKKDVTSAVTWSSSDTAIATVSAAGLVTGLKAGAAVITATSGTIFGTVTISVSAASPTLTSMAVTAAASSVPAGQTTQLAASGTYSDGSGKDLTASAAWSSADASIASVSSAGLVTGVKAGTVVITATSGTVSGTITISVSAASPTLTSLAVTAAASSVSAGQTTQLAASGTYSDGSSKDLTASAVWSSSDTTIATVSTSDLLTGVKAGMATITATSGSVTGNVSITVAASVLTSLTLTPNPVSAPAGTTVQLAASGTYSDQSTEDLTSTVSWTSADPGIATISQSGSLTAVAPGTTSITVVSGALNASVPVTVGAPVLSRIVLSPATATVPAGVSQSFVAYGYFSDGSSQDVSAQATWVSSDPTVATTAAALATGNKAGAVTITASLDQVVGTASLTVAAAALQQVDIAPDLPIIDIGADLQFAATGTFSDGSTGVVSAAWASAQPTVATVDATSGMAKGIAAGISTITATVGAVTDTTTLTVNPAALASIAVTPANPSLAAGTTQQFVATATFTDGSTQVLGAAAWSSDQPSVLTVDPATGLATAVAAGVAQVSATSGTVSGVTTVMVTAVTLQSLAITPATASMGIGGTLQFTATGTFSDNSTQDLTSAVTWSSSVGQVAIIAASGMATGLAQGTTNIVASYGSVSASAVLTITSATLQSIDVQPNSPVMVPRSRLQLHAIGTFTDGTTHELVGVTWSSTKPRFASVNGSGMVRSKKPGAATVKATLGSVSGTEVVTVTGATLSLLTMVPATATVSAGSTQKFAAMGTLSDGTTTDMSLAVRWTTSDFTTATVTSAGIATGVKPGTVTVTATYGSTAATATLTVN